ncbi:MAG: insulinase family protein, partial [Eggerthellaceae bacterium]|nr:insulinase family protein [Eggerthellaceae bacterium]
MSLDPGTTVNGFSIETRKPLEEIGGEAITAVHEPSGAKLLYLKNDDNNKAFAIGFRTPPKDDTGVFHILEHSVLCGSRKFPVKEPFVDLLKGSMQTFLNAMTFPDKTLYPVASTNEQDLYNLMDVYLDAVFHPRIYEKRAIFEQEGWHYELVANGEGDPATLPAEETELVYNGVVYNEMKGALSDATSVLYDELQKALLPDTPYAFESGGTPKSIPTLTYEDYLDDHRRHYRTDNSYIVLYGNLDAERALAFLDEQYL